MKLEGNQIARHWFNIFDAIILDYVDWAKDPAALNEDGNAVSGISIDPISHLLSALKLKIDSVDTVIFDQGLFYKSIVNSDIQHRIEEFESTWNQIIHRRAEIDAVAMNGLYLKAITQVIAAIQQVAIEYRMILQVRQWTNQLTKAVYFSIPQDEIYVAQLYAMIAPIIQGKTLSEQQKQEYRLIINRFERHFLRTKQLLESAYSMLLEAEVTNDRDYGKARALLLHTYRLLARYADSLEAIVLGKTGPETEHVEEQAREILDSIQKSRNSTDLLVVQLLETAHSRYIWQWWLMLGVLAFFVLCLSFVICFRLVTGYFLLIREYIEGLSQGQFNFPYHVSPNEEMGQVITAFQKMGQSISHLISQLQLLSKGLEGSTQQMAKTADEQARVVDLQKASMERLDTATKQISGKSRELADTMNAFTLTYKQQQVSNTSPEKAILMQNKMRQLTQAAANIVNVLSQAQNKVSITDRLTGFMGKVSERASMLSLNAAIEVITIGQHKQMFSDITEKIHRFSEKTSLSTEAIQKIVRGMSQSIINGQATAENCFKEISHGANRLIAVIQQLELIARQDVQQGINFQMVNEMMQAQAKTSEQIIVSLNFLSDTVKGNMECVQKLYQTIGSLGDTAHELHNVLQDLFSNQPSSGNHS